MFESIAACFSHGESQTHLYCPGNCQKNRGAHQWGKAATGSQAVCMLEYNGIIHVEFTQVCLYTGTINILHLTVYSI